jgi:hypothetical protein
VRIATIAPEFVVSFPPTLEPGVLYVSTRFSSAAHLCACGCCREVVTPISPAQWILTFDGSVSLRPSIGNWAFPCESHYVIDQGEVRWERSFTRHEARSNRQSDHQILDEAIAANEGWWRRALRRLRIR